jgi:magnesium transporter
MITIFHKTPNGISPMVIDAGSTIPEGALWLDILNPTLEEERSIETQLGIAIPSKEEVWKNEVLNRFYSEGGVSYMTCALITKMDSPYPQTSAVTFILAEKYLVTIRYINPTSFQNFSERILRRANKFNNGAEVMEGLLEEIITRVAHNSEVVVEVLDALSHDIFGAGVFENNRKNPSQVMQAVLRRLGTCNDLNSKINESLHSLQRMLSYFKEVQLSGKEINHAIRTLSNDVQSLTKQTDFLGAKINFQLDATLGMINVEQNLIIKIFSVVAVFFLPPTLVSSIYGMNFAYMPELGWDFGYPVAVGFMVMCAVVPYLYFRKKGWL